MEDFVQKIKGSLGLVFLSRKLGSDLTLLDERRMSPKTA
jgi:hypothetical protein